MRILFDQNISFRVVKKLSQSFPEARQVKELGLEGSTDLQIWEYAKRNQYTIVTFDADFYDLANIKGHPPKIIWLRIGNSTTDYIVQLFNLKFDLIKDFISNPDYEEIACIEIES